MFGSCGEGFNEPLLRDIYRTGVHCLVRVSPPPLVFNSLQVNLTPINTTLLKDLDRLRLDGI